MDFTNRKEIASLLGKYVIQEMTMLIQVHVLFKFILFVEKRSAGLWKEPYSYQLSSNTFKVHVCEQCSNSSVTIIDTIDMQYVAEEVNRQVYFKLGSKSSEYFKLTRCSKCQGKSNVLYASHHTKGDYPIRSLHTNLPIAVHIYGYDDRWYLGFFKDVFNQCSSSGRVNIHFSTPQSIVAQHTPNYLVDLRHHRHF
jgi:hypothetical protein